MGATIIHFLDKRTVNPSYSDSFKFKNCAHFWKE